MVDHGIGRTDEEARANKRLANAVADALASAAQRGGTMRTVTLAAPASGGHQTWTDAGVSECPDCLRTRVCFVSPFGDALVAHFCLSCWELVLERDRARVAWTSRRLAKVLHDTRGRRAFHVHQRHTRRARPTETKQRELGAVLQSGTAPRGGRTVGSSRAA